AVENRDRLDHVGVGQAFGLLAVVVHSHAKKSTVKEIEDHLLHCISVAAWRAAGAISRPPRELLDKSGTLMEGLQLGLGNASQHGHGGNRTSEFERSVAAKVLGRSGHTAQDKSEGARADESKFLHVMP